MKKEKRNNLDKWYWAIPVVLLFGLHAWMDISRGRSYAVLIDVVLAAYYAVYACVAFYSERHQGECRQAARTLLNLSPVVLILLLALKRVLY